MTGPAVWGGHVQAHTPNIDRLAQRGILFRRAYCAAPLCNPSRASLMTGVLPSNSGVYENPQDWRQSERLKDAVTLPQYFRQNGYWVAGGGKLYHSNQDYLSRGYDHAESWDVRFPSRSKQLPDPAVSVGQNLSGVQNRYKFFDFGPIDVDDSATMDGRTVDWAIEQLQKTHDKPFFLAVGIYRPHIPWYVPKKYYERLDTKNIILPEINENDLDDVPAPGKVLAFRENDHKRIVGGGKWKEGVQAYLASVTFADAMLGRLLQAFDKSPYADNTVICLWSDHGWHLGEKLHWQKWALWEEATRVPLIFVAPGISQPDTACDRVVSLIDVYPTLVDLLGLPTKKDIDGQSLVPLMRDPGQEWNRPALTTVAHNAHAIRSERWRYIRYADGSEELYDHEKDELEWNNLAGIATYAEIKKQLNLLLPAVNIQPDPQRGKSKSKPKNTSIKPVQSTVKGETINLLAKIDPKQQSVEGQWSLENNTLNSSQSSAARIEIHQDLPDEYDLLLHVKRSKGSGNFAIGLVMGGSQFAFILDGGGGKISGLSLLDGKQPSALDSDSTGSVFGDGQVKKILCQVRKRHLTVRIDGQSFKKWEGDPKRLSMNPFWSVPNKKQIFLGAHESAYSISQMKITGQSSKPKK